jgi:hypothetical protein
MPKGSEVGAESLRATQMVTTWTCSGECWAKVTELYHDGYTKAAMKMNDEFFSSPITFGIEKGSLECNLCPCAVAMSSRPFF